MVVADRLNVQPASLLLIEVIADQDRELFEIGEHRCAHATLTVDDDESVLAVAPHDYRLKNTDLTDARGQCFQFLRVEGAPRLIRIRGHCRQRHFQRLAADDLLSGLSRRDHCPYRRGGGNDGGRGGPVVQTHSVEDRFPFGLPSHDALSSTATKPSAAGRPFHAADVALSESGDSQTGQRRLYALATASRCMSTAPAAT